MNGKSLTLALLVASAAAYTIKDLGSFDVKHSGFLSLANDNKDLIVSSFPTLGSGSIHVVENIGKHLKKLPSVEPTTLVSSTVWPNAVTQAPLEVFGFPVVVIAGGFLPPTVSTGRVTAVNVTEIGAEDAATKLVSTHKYNWFYHMVKFVDVNEDGLIDILTARATFPVIGTAKGEMIWLEHPAKGKDAWTEEWEEHVMFDGPEVMFDIADLDDDGKWEVVAAQFFQPKVSLFWTEGDYVSGPWKTRVLDETLGAMIGVSIDDLNRDGKLDILVTNHVNDAELSGAYAFEVPTKIATGKFKMHTLFNNISTTLWGLNQASPGIPVLCHPKSPASKDEMPHIVLPGDGAQKVFLMKPVGNFQYETTEVIEWKGTAGGSVCADVDGDGKTEFFVPNWDHGYVQGWKFA